MKKSWIADRIYTPSNPEKKFESLLKENGYDIKGYKFYQTFTQYLIHKDNITHEFRLPSVDNLTARGVLAFYIFEEDYNLHKKVEELTAKNKK